MKKVRILFSVFFVVVVAAATIAVKANPNDIVYVYDERTGICDIAVNATTIPNAQILVMQAIAATRPGICSIFDLYVTQ